VAVGINAPTGPRYATDILWYLYHDKVNVYVDGDGEWCVMFETRCRNLGEGFLCAVYEDRPHICRTFDNRSCEVNSPEGESTTFREPAQFLSWLKEKRPRVYRQIEKRFVPPSVAAGVPR
jgi:Fe-S-cluster containining protein